jgi:hypothetical protein
MDVTWIITSEQFIARSNQNKEGKIAGKRSIWFNGKKRDRSSGKSVEHPYLKFDEFRVKDFGVFRSVAKLAMAPNVGDDKS